MNWGTSLRIFLLAIALPGWLASAGEAASRIIEIRQWTAPDHTRIVIDIQGTPLFEISPAADPLILTVNLQKVAPLPARQEMAVHDPIIRKITIGPVGREGAEIAISLVKPARWNSFVLKPYLDKPDRLVIDILRPDLEEKEKEGRQVTQELKARKTRIVVVDAGHGGDDPGAVGPRKTLEKEIVLAMAKKLQRVIDGSGNLRAFLTRRGDYFVPLDERIRIAQEYGADLFISLHTNGSVKRSTRGTAIYCLSLKGASDKAAQLLAQKENSSDMVGGTSAAGGRRDLDSILLDLEQTHTINESLHLGGLALSELSRVNPIQFPRPLQAGFAVLKAPSIPSILVETAYITHPVEESNLRQDRFQTDITQAIFSAVKKFLPMLSGKEEKDRLGSARLPRTMENGG